MAYGVNAPFGLQPRFYANGSLWTGQQSEYFIPSGYNTNIFTGDPVALAANGVIAIGTAGNAICGVFLGVKYFDSNNNYVFSPYWPAATVTFNAMPAVAYVADDPNILFDVQTDGQQMGQTNTYGITVPDLNWNFNFVAGAGSTISGQSGYMVDNTTEAAGATLNLKLIRLVPRPNNSFGAGTALVPNYNNGLFLINNHQYKGGTGTAGV